MRCTHCGQTMPVPLAHECPARRGTDYYADWRGIDGVKRVPR